MENEILGGIGTQADIAADVDINTVHGGYFSNSANIEEFIKIGLLPIMKLLPESVKYVDAGGGTGILANAVKQKLISAEVLVIDANSSFLRKAMELGLETMQVDLHKEEINLSEINLITMRAVLHYNSETNQKSILKNIHDSLSKGGIFLNQASAGSAEIGELKDAIVNLKELNRKGAGNYSWLSTEKIVEMTKKAGFSKVEVVGLAPSGRWSPEEQWDRFNKTDEGKETFLKLAYELIENYKQKYGNGIEDENGELFINYEYPIILAIK